MGSKNNNGKFDFKAARTKVDGLWKGKSPAGLSDDLDLNGVTELWRGGEKAPAVCSHLSSQTKKNFFFCGGAGGVGPEKRALWHLRNTWLESSFDRTQFYPVKKQNKTMQDQFLFNQIIFCSFGSSLWTTSLGLLFSVAGAWWGAQGTFSQCHCEIFILAGRS